MISCQWESKIDSAVRYDCEMYSWGKLFRVRVHLKEWGAEEGKVIQITVWGKLTSYVLLQAASKAFFLPLEVASGFRDLLEEKNFSKTNFRRKYIGGIEDSALPCKYLCTLDASSPLAIALEVFGGTVYIYCLFSMEIFLILSFSSEEAVHGNQSQQIKWPTHKITSFFSSSSCLKVWGAWFRLGVLLLHLFWPDTYISSREFLKPSST